jgi:RNA polymerase sigma-70 factor (family 1)
LLPLFWLNKTKLSSELIHNEQEFFRKIGNGDSNAFTEMFHYYNGRLFPFVRRLTKSETIAEEIVQEVFLRLWINREKVAVMENPGAWLFTVASNLSITHLRNVVTTAVKHAAAYHRNESKITDSPLNRLDGKEMAAIIEAAVRKLPPRQQEIFRLNRYQGLKNHEIAEKLAISNSTVKGHLNLALKSIREHINTQTGSTIGIALLIAALKNY